MTPNIETTFVTPKGHYQSSNVNIEYLNIQDGNGHNIQTFVSIIKIIRPRLGFVGSKSNFTCDFIFYICEDPEKKEWFPFFLCP